MDPTLEVVLVVLAVVAAVAGTFLAWRVSERQLRGPVASSGAEEAVVPSGVAAVLGALRSSAVVVDSDDRVLQASAPAYTLGLVRDARLCITELGELVRQVRRDGETRQADLVVERGLGHAPTYVHARVASLSSRLVLVLAEDRTRERRVEAIRQDFVVNVSHELKTPVGALQLLAEAVAEAADDPEAVTRFAARIQTEATRLSRLVQQIIELSRLQHDHALDQPLAVDLDRVVERAVDVIAIEAKAKDIDLVYDGQRGLEVLGDEDQIRLALGNLLANAVTYSPDHSKVVVSAVRGERVVDLTVTDQGIGIPAEELDRIFERFYRVDPARHRSTGGTGLGLSIVKHVAATHGGEVMVWSAQGQGSSFTLRLPRPADPPLAPHPAAPHPAAPHPAARNAVEPQEKP